MGGVQDNELRQAAVYGLGIAAQHRQEGFRPIAPQVPSGEAAEGPRAMPAGSRGTVPFLPASSKAHVKDRCCLQAEQACAWRCVHHGSAQFFVRSPLVTANVPSCNRQCNLVGGSGCDLLMLERCGVTQIRSMCWRVQGVRCVALQACNILVAGISSPQARSDESSMCTDNAVCALGKVRTTRLPAAAAHSCSLFCVAESSVLFRVPAETTASWPA